MAEDTRDGYGKQFYPINVWSLELKALYFVVIFSGYLLQPLHCTAFVFPRVLHGGFFAKWSLQVSLSLSFKCQMR